MSSRDRIPSQWTISYEEFKSYKATTWIYTIPLHYQVNKNKILNTNVALHLACSLKCRNYCRNNNNKIIFMVLVLEFWYLIHWPHQGKCIVQDLITGQHTTHVISKIIPLPFQALLESFHSFFMFVIHPVHKSILKLRPYDEIKICAK